MNGQPAPRVGVGERARGRREDPDDLGLLEPPRRVGRDAAEERVDAPAGRAASRAAAARRRPRRVSRGEADLLLGLAQRRREQVGVARLRLAAREPELAAVQAAVVGADDEHDAQLAVGVAEDGERAPPRPQLRLT